MLPAQLDSINESHLKDPSISTPLHFFARASIEFGTRAVTIRSMNYNEKGNWR